MQINVVTLAHLLSEAHTEWTWSHEQSKLNSAFLFHTKGRNYLWWSKVELIDTKSGAHRQN